MTHLRWGRVIGLAIALEAALFAVLVPIQGLLPVKVWFALVAIGCALFSYIAGRLVAKGLASGAALHGLVVGATATVIYLVICTLAPGGLAAAVSFYGAPLYVSLNALRIAGCVAGALHQVRLGTVRRAAAVPR